MYKLARIIFIIFIAAFFVSCSKPEVIKSNAVQTPAMNQNIETLEAEQKAPSMPATTNSDIKIITPIIDEIKIYNDISSLGSEAEIVFTGKSMDVSYFYYKEGLWTLSHIKADKVLKGNIKTGDTVAIVEDGGYSTNEEYIKGTNIEHKPGDGYPTEKELKQKILVTFQGVPPIEKDQELLLFAQDTKGWYRGIKETVYYIVGSTDGKFLHTGDYYERPKTNDNNYKTLKTRISEIEKMKF